MYGYTDGCVGCEAKKRGEVTRRGHSEKCRKRMDERMRQDEAGRRRIDKTEERLTHKKARDLGKADKKRRAEEGADRDREIPDGVATGGVVREESEKEEEERAKRRRQEDEDHRRRAVAMAHEIWASGTVAPLVPLHPTPQNYAIERSKVEVRSVKPRRIFHRSRSRERMKWKWARRKSAS